MALAGIGNGAFWPAQSTLIAGLTPPDRRHAAFAMQRVMMNLGIGFGGVAGGLIATTDDPGAFTVLFLGDALTFLLYLGVLTRVRPRSRARQPARRRRYPDGYATVLRDRAFIGVIALNTLLIFAGMSRLRAAPGLRRRTRRA